MEAEGFDWSVEGLRRAIHDDALLERAFEIADGDGDGRIGPADAKSFYVGSKLQCKFLSTVWKAATHGELKYITGLEDFRMSLRMVLEELETNPQTGGDDRDGGKGESHAAPGTEPEPTQGPSAQPPDHADGIGHRPTHDASWDNQLSHPTNLLSAGVGAMENDGPLRGSVEASEGNRAESVGAPVGFAAEGPDWMSQATMGSLGGHRAAAPGAIHAPLDADFFSELDPSKGRSTAQAPPAADPFTDFDATFGAPATSAPLTGADSLLGSSAWDSGANALVPPQAPASQDHLRGGHGSGGGAGAGLAMGSVEFDVAGGHGGSDVGSLQRERDALMSDVARLRREKQDLEAQVRDLQRQVGDMRAGAGAGGVPVPQGGAGPAAQAGGWGGAAAPAPVDDDPWAQFGGGAAGGGGGGFDDAQWESFPAGSGAPSPAREGDGLETWPPLGAAERQRCVDAFDKVYRAQGGVSRQDALAMFERAKLPGDLFPPTFALASGGSGQSQLDADSFLLFMYLLKASKEGRTLPGTIPPAQRHRILAGDAPHAGQSWDAPATPEASAGGWGWPGETPTAGDGAAPSPQVQQLVGMGFSEADASVALQRFGSTDAAANWLAEGGGVGQGAPHSGGYSGDTGADWPQRGSSFDVAPDSVVSSRAGNGVYYPPSETATASGGADGFGPAVPGDVQLRVLLGELSCDPGKDNMAKPFVVMSVVNVEGVRVENPQRTNEAQPTGPANWHVGVEIKMETPLHLLQPGMAVILEILHVKDRKKGKESVRAWAAVRLDDVVRPNPDGSFSIKDGTISLRLFAKPTSPTLRNLKQLVPKARRGKSPEYTNRLKIRLTASA